MVTAYRSSVWAVVVKSDSGGNTGGQVMLDGSVTFGGQTHPADDNAAIIVTTREYVPVPVVLSA